MNGYSEDTTAPVKVGDEFETTIDAVGEKGDGLAKKEGFVIFVPNTNTGDRVRVRVTKVLRKVGFGEVVGKAGDSAPAEEQSQDEESSDEPEEEFDTSNDSDDFGDDDSEEEKQ